VVRHFLKFSWAELAAAIARSAVATFISTAGPLAVIWAVGGEALSIPLAIAAGALAGGGWIAGLWLTRHPLLQEMILVSVNLRSRIALKLAGRA
jgi:hypothetical protein